jgi:hypothetical protein
MFLATLIIRKKSRLSYIVEMPVAKSLVLVKTSCQTGGGGGGGDGPKNADARNCGLESRGGGGGHVETKILRCTKKNIF